MSTREGAWLTSGNASRQDSVLEMRTEEALHSSRAGWVQPMRSKREITSTMRDAKRTMIALQGWVAHANGCGRGGAAHASGCGRGVPSTEPSPEKCYLDGSTLSLVSLILCNKVVDEGESDVEHKDDSGRQQGSQVKGHTLLQVT